MPRIVYLSPSIVASSHHIGENPEDEAGNRLEDFIKSVNLPVIKPDFRVYGFNNPCPQEEQSYFDF